MKVFVFVTRFYLEAGFLIMDLKNSCGFMPLDKD